MLHTYSNGNKSGTTSEGKLDTIARQVAAIKQFKTQYKIKFDGAIYGLPGPYMQCPRHIKEYKEYGFQERKQVLIEYRQDIHQSQKRWAERDGFRGACIKGNAYEIVEHAAKNGAKLSAIDFDKCGALSEQDHKLLENASRAKVDFVILTVCTKVKLTPDLAKYKKKLRLRKRWKSCVKKKCEPIRVISERTIEKWASKYGFEVKSIPYYGKSPMCVFVLLNVGKYDKRQAGKFKAF